MPGTGIFICHKVNMLRTYKRSTSLILLIVEMPNAKKLRMALRQIPGALIWLHRTRLDIGFDIAKIATDSVQACGDVEAELETSMHSL